MSRGNSVALLGACRPAYQTPAGHQLASAVLGAVADTRPSNGYYYGQQTPPIVNYVEPPKLWDNPIRMPEPHTPAKSSMSQPMREWLYAKL
jgi:hypothetical protein